MNDQILRIQMQGVSLSTEQLQCESLNPSLGHVLVIRVLLSSQHGFDSTFDVGGLSGRFPFEADSLSVQGHQRVKSGQHQ